MKLESVIDPVNIQVMCSVARECPPGCFVEVGVYRGGSGQALCELAQEQQRQVFLYDTFTGIPYQDTEAGDRHPVGDFHDTAYDIVKAALPYAHVIQGIFPSSAVRMGPVAFAHIDCDQYRAVKESCEYLESLMVPGGVMWFDDYNCLDGAKKAVDEVFGDRIVLNTKANKFMVTL